MFKSTAIGNIGSDANVKTLKDGSQVANFNVASNESYTTASGEKKEVTTWLNCSLFKNQGKSTKIFEFLKKGQLVYLEGKVSAECYTSKEGKPIAAIKFRVDIIMLTGKAPDSGNNHAFDEQGNITEDNVSNVL